MVVLHNKTGLRVLLQESLIGSGRIDTVKGHTVHREKTTEGSAVLFEDGIKISR